MTCFLRVSLALLAFHPTSALNDDDDPEVGEPRPLVDHPACKGDLISLSKSCGVTRKEMREDDVAALMCAQNRALDRVELTKTCEQVLWSFKMRLTREGLLFKPMRAECKLDWPKFEECERSHPPSEQPGKFVSCAIDVRDRPLASACRDFMTDVKTIVFSDYRLIGDFAEACGPDIEGKLCGSVSSGLTGSLSFHHSQGTVIQCLMENIGGLDEKCHHETLRIAELQSDDYHLDRTLYFACKEDREAFCSDVPSGEGRVFTCLDEHIEKVSAGCGKEIERRKKMEEEDYKVNYDLRSACRRELEKNGCAGAGSSSKPKVMLCLADAIRLDEQQEFGARCRTALDVQRKQIMSDPKLSGDLMSGCAAEIEGSCPNEGRATIHCLMRAARDGSLRPDGDCQRSLMFLMDEIDLASNWKLDPVLDRACGDVALDRCDEGDREGVMQCLFEVLREGRDDAMADECGQRLREIQYFLARDFRLLPKLHKACRKDAKRLCNAAADWHVDTAGRGHVFPCLVRYVRPEEEEDGGEALAPGCRHQVGLALRRRASSLKLHPEMEESCRSDLALHCGEGAEKSGENPMFLCLQDNLNLLNSECMKSVVQHTRVEAADANLNSDVVAACRDVIFEQRCEGDGALMRCLLAYKESQADGEITNPSYRQCFKALHHWQKIAVKDVRFSARFYRACKRELKRHCDTASPDKWKVIDCLSDAATEDAVAKRANARISKGCLKELKFELLQRHSDVTLNPRLGSRCSDEISTKCPPSEGPVLECLKSLKHREVSYGCRKALFAEEREEAVFNSVDRALTLACKAEIKRFCGAAAAAEPNGMLTCLRSSRDDASFGPKCKRLVRTRTVQQSRDYRLNPALMTACADDLQSHCVHVIQNVAEAKTDFLDGKILDCLTNALMAKRTSVSAECRAEVKVVMRHAAVDYEADPVLLRDCPRSIAVCKSQVDLTAGDVSEDGLKVEECLKSLLGEYKLVPEDGKRCQESVARRIELGNVDLSLDPVMKRACAMDMNEFCRGVEITPEQQTECLALVLYDGDLKLRPGCEKVLKKRLKELSTATKLVKMDGFEDLYRHLVSSPHRNYFLSVGLTILFFIFVFGLCCGRATRRARRELIQKVR